MARREDEPRILFPFAAGMLTPRQLNAAFDLAVQEEGCLVAAYLALLPTEVSLEAPLARELERAFPLLEYVEQEATRRGVPVETRLERGHTAREALGDLMEHERFDRLALPGGDWLRTGDVDWARERAACPVDVLA